jgi:translation initiation factor IF-1
MGKSKDDVITMDGIVMAAHPGAKFTVQLETVNNPSVLCHISGKIRKNFIRIIVGDRVTVEMSPYDLTKGRIVYRYSPVKSPLVE